MRSWFERSIQPATKWMEPIRFERRRMFIYIRIRRAFFVRIFFWGLALAAITHFIVAHYQLPIARPAWSLYLIAPIIPGMLLVQLLLSACLPQWVYIGPASIRTQSGSHARQIAWKSVITHRLIPVGERGDAALVLLYRTRRGRRRVLSIGIARKVDILALDEMLRRLNAGANPGLPHWCSSDPACSTPALHPRG